MFLHYNLLLIYPKGIHVSNIKSIYAWKKSISYIILPYNFPQNYIHILLLLFFLKRKIKFIRLTFNFREPKTERITFRNEHNLQIQTRRTKRIKSSIYIYIFSQESSSKRNNSLHQLVFYLRDRTLLNIPNLLLSKATNS